MKQGEKDSLSDVIKAVLLFLDSLQGLYVGDTNFILFPKALQRIKRITATSN